MEDILGRGTRSRSRRLLTSVVIFLVVAGAVYATAWVTLFLLRQVVMPAISVIVAGYLAVKAYQVQGRSQKDRRPPGE